MNTITITTTPTIKINPVMQAINKEINYPLNKAQKLLVHYAKLTQFPLESLTGTCRQADIMLTRKAIWLKMRKEGYTLKEIANAFNRTHPTIISGIYNIEGLLQIKDKKAIQELNKLNLN